MTKVRVRLELDADELAARLSPRDDFLVREERETAECDKVTPPSDSVGASITRFVASAGPWAHYERTVTAEPTPNHRFRVEEAIRARFDVPTFGRLFDALARRDLARRGRRWAPASSKNGSPVRRGQTDVRHAWYGPSQRLEPHEARTLGICSTISVLAGFLSGLVSRVMTYSVADFRAGVDPAQQTATVAFALTVIRIGVAAAFFGLIVADRVGRRRVLVWSCALGTASCAISAAAPSLGVFISFQTLTRTTAAVLTVLCAVIVAEELPAAVRAYATGMLGMSFAAGAGAVLFAFPLSGVAAWGWRLVALTVLVLVPMTVRAIRLLPETKRFAQLRDTRMPKQREQKAEVAPTRSRIERRDDRTGIRARFTAAGFPFLRLLKVAVLFFFLAVATTPASQLQTDYLRTVRHYSPSTSSLFIISTNIPGAIGVLLGGRLSDVHGRRALAAIGLIGIAFQSVLYMVGGWQMWAVSVVSALIGGCAVPTLGAFGPELFPTRFRTTANGALHIASILGGLLGLAVAGALIARSGYGATFGVLALFVAGALALVATLPETSHRELEDISPDDEAASTARATFTL